MDNGPGTGTGTPFGQKKCPKCGYKNHPRSMKCQNPTGCSMRWEYGNREKPVQATASTPKGTTEYPSKSDATPDAEATIERKDEDFICGYNANGDAFIGWNSDAVEFIQLTKRQTAVLRSLFLKEESSKS